MEWPNRRSVFKEMIDMEVNWKENHIKEAIHNVRD